MGTEQDTGCIELEVLKPQAKSILLDQECCSCDTDDISQSCVPIVVSATLLPCHSNQGWSDSRIQSCSSSGCDLKALSWSPLFSTPIFRPWLSSHMEVHRSVGPRFSSTSAYGTLDSIDSYADEPWFSNAKNTARPYGTKQWMSCSLLLYFYLGSDMKRFEKDAILRCLTR